MPYQITFENSLADAVVLEIRVGNEADCDGNQPFYNDQIAAGGNKVIETDANVVCYRRTADPDNPGIMTAWDTFSPNDINTPADIDIGLM